MKEFTRKKALWFTSTVLIIAVVIWFVSRPDSDTLRVPLGVEQAAIVTYGGPRLTVAPYKWGVAVNVRIAEVVEQPDRRVYDLRYIVNRAGTFDLKDYLAADDGSELTGLPTFKFAGDPKLSKNLDTRIEETEQIRLDVGGRYYETLAGLAVLWIGWLFLLLFYKRPQPEADPDPVPPAPTPAEQLRGFLTRIEAGTLNVEAKAEMEMVLIHYWRNELGLGDRRMASTLDYISRHDKTREPLRKLQHWIHDPSSKVLNDEIVAVIRPYTAEVIP